MVDSVVIQIDAPAANSTVAPVVQVRGWAANFSSANGTGLDTVHFYLDGPADRGLVLGVGAPTARPDVARQFGRPDWANAGFVFTTPRLTPGTHAIYVYAFNSNRPDRWVQTVTFVVGQGPVAAAPAPAPAVSGQSRYPFISAEQDDSVWPCLAENPSCRREEWWSEWNDLQRSDLVGFDFAPGLVAEYRFAEAIRLIWQWPEGKALLMDAGALGVAIGSLPQSALPEAFAAFSPDGHVIGVSIQFVQTSTWMVADLLAHEMQHAQDFKNRIRTGGTYADCIEREQVAYAVEGRYLGWIAARMGGLPPTREVARTLSAEDGLLFANLRAIADARDLDQLATNDYRQSCQHLATRNSGP
ncbi:MAG: hypothetical protein HW416_1706 [Chloroflexi bacterium]|nr:hypothetical protein [Chloroflexota bacterium]